MSETLIIKKKQYPRYTPEEHEKLMQPIYERQKKEAIEWLLEQKRQREQNERRR